MSPPPSQHQIEGGAQSQKWSVCGTSALLLDFRKIRETFHPGLASVPGARMNLSLRSTSKLAGPQTKGSSSRLAPPTLKHPLICEKLSCADGIPPHTLCAAPFISRLSVFLSSLRNACRYLEYPSLWLPHKTDQNPCRTSSSIPCYFAWTDSGGRLAHSLPSFSPAASCLYQRLVIVDHLCSGLPHFLVVAVCTANFA